MGIITTNTTNTITITSTTYITSAIIECKRTDTDSTMMVITHVMIMTRRERGTSLEHL
jgi:hypothetical protein